jgi:predicted NBD/HSP70 family sugar kinase
MFASSRAALRFLQSKTGSQDVFSIQQLMNLEASGNPDAQQAVLKQIEAIGRGLRIVTASFDPELILFVGDITLRWSAIEPILSKELTSRMLAGPAPKIAALADGEAARLRGAAVVVLQRHTGFRRQSFSR